MTIQNHLVRGLITTCSVVTFSISCSAMVGYLLQMPLLYGWGPGAEMAFPTSLSLVLISLGMFLMNLLQQWEHRWRHRPPVTSACP